LPIDQQTDDALSSTFESQQLSQPLTLLGAPVLRLAISADTPQALVSARLCEMTDDGRSHLVSWGLLNLTHRDGDEYTEPLEPGRVYEVAVHLNALGHTFAAGSRLRLALSNTYWPHAWPSPRTSTLQIHLGQKSSIDLPACAPSAAPVVEFEPAEKSDALDDSASGVRVRRRTSELESRRHLILDRDERRSLVGSTQTTFSAVSEDDYSIADDDPLSATTSARRIWSLDRPGWTVRVVADATLTCDAEHFFVDDSLQAWLGDELVHRRTQRFELRRDGV